MYWKWPSVLTDHSQMTFNGQWFRLLKHDCITGELATMNFLRRGAAVPTPAWLGGHARMTYQGRRWRPRLYEEDEANTRRGFLGIESGVAHVFQLWPTG